MENKACSWAHTKHFFDQSMEVALKVHHVVYTHENRPMHKLIGKNKVNHNTLFTNWESPSEKTIDYSTMEKNPFIHNCYTIQQRTSTAFVNSIFYQNLRGLSINHISHLRRMLVLVISIKPIVLIFWCNKWSKCLWSSSDIRSTKLVHIKQNYKHKCLLETQIGIL